MLVALGIVQLYGDPSFQRCGDEFATNHNGIVAYPSYQENGTPLPAPIVPVTAGPFYRPTINVGGHAIYLKCKTVPQGSLYAVAFNSDRGIPDWVVYRATRARTIAYTGGSAQTLSRNGSQFYMDQELISAGARQAAPFSYDQFNSIVGPGAEKFAKGHYMPAHAALYDPRALNATFSFINAAPQHPRMNSGVWNKLESWIKEEVQADKNLTVITGTYGTARTNNIPASRSKIGPFPEYRATIPAGFYKVVYQADTNETIAFLIPNVNTANKGVFTSYAITVSDLEKRMRYDANTTGQPSYSIIFNMPPGTNKGWPSGVLDNHWPGRNGIWPDNNRSTKWYDYNASGDSVLKNYPVGDTASFPGL